MIVTAIAAFPDKAQALTAAERLRKLGFECQIQGTTLFVSGDERNRATMVGQARRLGGAVIKASTAGSYDFTPLVNYLRSKGKRRIRQEQLLSKTKELLGIEVRKNTEEYSQLLRAVRAASITVEASIIAGPADDKAAREVAARLVASLDPPYSDAQIKEEWSQTPGVRPITMQDIKAIRHALKDRYGLSAKLAASDMSSIFEFPSESVASRFVDGVIRMKRAANAVALKVAYKGKRAIVKAAGGAQQDVERLAKSLGGKMAMVVSAKASLSSMELESLVRYMKVHLDRPTEQLVRVSARRFLHKDLTDSEVREVMKAAGVISASTTQLRRLSKRQQQSRHRETIRLTNELSRHRRAIRSGHLRGRGAANAKRVMRELRTQLAELKMSMTPIRAAVSPKTALAWNWLRPQFDKMTGDDHVNSKSYDLFAEAVRKFKLNEMPPNDEGMELDKLFVRYWGTRFKQEKKRGTFKASSLVAAETLRPGDMILATWGRDVILSVDKERGVLTTKKNRKMSLRRRGKPRMLSKADTYAASISGYERKGLLRVLRETFKNDIPAAQEVLRVIEEHSVAEGLAYVKENYGQFMADDMRKKFKGAGVKASISASRRTISAALTPQQAIDITTKAGVRDKFRQRVEKALGTADSWGEFEHMIGRWASFLPMLKLEQLTKSYFASLSASQSSDQQRGSISLTFKSPGRARAFAAKAMQYGKVSCDQCKVSVQHDHAHGSAVLALAGKYHDGGRSARAATGDPIYKAVAGPFGTDLERAKAELRRLQLRNPGKRYELANKVPGGYVVHEVTVQASTVSAAAGKGNDKMLQLLEQVINSEADSDIIPIMRAFERGGVAAALKEVQKRLGDEAVYELKRRGFKASISAATEGKGRAYKLRGFANAAKAREAMQALKAKGFAATWDGVKVVTARVLNSAEAAEVDRIVAPMLKFQALSAAFGRVGKPLSPELQKMTRTYKLRGFVNAAKAREAWQALKNAGYADAKWDGVKAVDVKILNDAERSEVDKLVAPMKAYQASASQRSVRAAVSGWQLVDKSNRPIKPGAAIKDFRGDTYKFLQIVKAPGGGSTGKIEVDPGEDSRPEVYYPEVFSAKIVSASASASQRSVRASGTDLLKKIDRLLGGHLRNGRNNLRGLPFDADDSESPDEGLTFRFVDADAAKQAVPILKSAGIQARRNSQTEVVVGASASKSASNTPSVLAAQRADDSQRNRNGVSPSYAAAGDTVEISWSSATSERDIDRCLQELKNRGINAEQSGNTRISVPSSYAAQAKAIMRKFGLRVAASASQTPSVLAAQRAEQFEKSRVRMPSAKLKASSHAAKEN